MDHEVTKWNPIAGKYVNNQPASIDITYSQLHKLLAIAEWVVVLNNKSEITLLYLPQDSYKSLHDIISRCSIARANYIENAAINSEHCEIRLLYLQKMGTKGV